MSMTHTYITRTLSDILPGVDEFTDEIVKKLNFSLSEDENNYLFTLIYSKYADSHVRYTNEELFKMNLQRAIMIYYPMVMAMLRDQNKIRDGTDEEFSQAGKTIANTSMHNTNIEYANDTTKGLPQVDGQSIGQAFRGKLDVHLQRMELYRAGMESDFLKKLTPLFVQIIYPQRDLLYITEE